MVHQSNVGPEISRLVERQLRRWEMTRQQHASFLEPNATAKVQDFVCISRAVGSGGAAAAASLAERLGWAIFDREILQAMAGDDATRNRLYQQLDEHDTSWLQEMLRWVFEGGWRQDDYFHRLTETVLALSRKSKLVFVGRGADLILPKHQGLRVRITAPHEYCVQSFAQRNGLSYSEAEAEVRKIEQERAEWLKHHFGKRAAETARFDLCVNAGRMTQDQAVEVIVNTLRTLHIVS